MKFASYIPKKAIVRSHGLAMLSSAKSFQLADLPDEPLLLILTRLPVTALLRLALLGKG